MQISLKQEYYDQKAALVQILKNAPKDKGLHLHYNACTAQQLQNLRWKLVVFSSCQENPQENEKKENSKKKNSNKEKSESLTYADKDP